MLGIRLCEGNFALFSQTISGGDFGAPLLGGYDADSIVLAGCKRVEECGFRRGVVFSDGRVVGAGIYRFYVSLGLIVSAGMMFAELFSF